VDLKYHDNFEGSIMMSKDDTVAKNEILRRIKWHKAKKNEVANYLRKRREEIVKERPPKEPESPKSPGLKRMSKMLGSGVEGLVGKSAAA
jgi:hypothetical protein